MRIAADDIRQSRVFQAGLKQTTNRYHLCQIDLVSGDSKQTSQLQGDCDEEATDSAGHRRRQRRRQNHRDAGTHAPPRARACHAHLCRRLSQVRPGRTCKPKITPLHPDCNYLDILELHLERAHYGEPMLKPVYDHSTGSLVRPEYVQPREFVIVEGLLGCHTAAMRAFYDVKVFLDPPEDLRRQWKIKRDTTKRGYTPEQVLAELERREADSRDFIRPQREHADIVVRFFLTAAPRWN